MNQALTLARRPFGQTLNQVVVWLYKVSGFAVLGAIVVALAWYMGGQVFYLFSRSWVTPMIVAANDARVLTVQTQMSQAQLAYDTAVLLRAEAVAALQGARRELQVEQAFSAGFNAVTRGDLRRKVRMLRRLEAIDAQYAALQPLPKSAQETSRLASLREARVIDDQQYTQRVAQASQAHFAALERQATLEARMAELRQDIRGLRAGVLSRAGSYDLLARQRDYERSQVAQVRLAHETDMWERKVTAHDAAIARNTTLLRFVGASPYLRAAEGSATYAFVPYSNLEHVMLGQAIYSCGLGPLWCEPAGEIGRVLEGEVWGKPPNRSGAVRGVLVDVQLDTRWAQKPLLQLNSWLRAWSWS